ncbi:MAG: protein kinase [Chitinivibrionales bacterium]|nr:protein kinase [Chitinivibrionales bacterium]
MTESGQPGNQTPPQAAPSGIANVESLTVLPDGSRPVPLGSGVISGILGEGGAAIVYEVWNEQLGVKRAVKLLRPNAMQTSFERFTTEMRITAQLRHPNIIEIHSVGQWHRLPFIEMERLEGCSLDKLIHKQGALPVPVAVAIGLMICRALKYTHNHIYSINGKQYRGILHRDLKPANVMIAENGVVKLMDFGIATPTDASMHTMEGTFVGSLQYLAPEQLEGRKASPSTDLYALGAVLYEMLTGAQAFSERNMTKLISMRLKNEYKPLQDYRIKMPARLLRFINRCMAFDREKRADNAVAALAELEAIYARITPMAPEELVEAYLHHDSAKRTIAFRRRVPVFRILGTTAALLAVLAGGYYAWTMRDQLMQLRAPEPQTIRDSIIITTGAEPETVFVTKEIPSPSPPPPAPKPKPRPEPVVKAPAPKPAPPKPAPPPPPPKKKEPSFLVTLTEKYGTDDLVAIMALEVGQRHYRSALRLYDSLSSDQMRTKRALLYKMRALQGAGDQRGLSEFFSANTIHDAEYYLAKARYLHGRDKYRAALAQLDNCNNAQAELLEQGGIQREVVYYKAVCLTGLYNRDASDQARNVAMESWYDVKFAFRNQQNHRYFKHANDQIRKMSAESGDSQ